MKYLSTLILILACISSCNNKNELTVDYGTLNPNDLELPTYLRQKVKQHF